MLTKKIFQQPVSAVAKKIENGEISSVELTRTVLEHAKEINSKTNAFISFREEKALEQAEKADDLLKKGTYLGIYHGIPIGIKDNIFLKDETTTMGSEIHRNHIPEISAIVVENLEKAGAVIIGKHNLHEYAWGVTNENTHFGDTHNPWDPERITGGSSGGSGAAISSGSSFAAVGTDTAGSVRIPASACGIVGFKPTRNLVSKEGVFPLSDSLDHVGPMGKTVEDVASLLDILAPSKEGENFYAKSTNRPLEGFRIGINEEYYFNQLDAPVEKIVRKSISLLEEQGVEIKEVKIPSLEQVAFIGYMTILSESFKVHEDNLTNRIKDFGPDIQGLYSMGIPNAVDYIKAQDIAVQLKKEFKEVFSEIDVLLTPTLPVLPPKIGDNKVLINGKEEDLNDHIMRFMFPSNITGVPSLSLPGGLAEGLPVGIQLIGAPFGEAAVLSVAKRLEDLIQFDLSANPVFNN